MPKAKKKKEKSKKGKRKKQKNNKKVKKVKNKKYSFSFKKPNSFSFLIIFSTDYFHIGIFFFY